MLYGRGVMGSMQAAGSVPCCAAMQGMHRHSWACTIRVGMLAGVWHAHPTQATHGRRCAHRIRKCWLEGTPVALVGQRADLSYPYEHLGEGGAALAKLLKGGPALEMLQSAERPAVIVGPGILSRGDRAAVLAQARPQPPVPTHAGCMPGLEDQGLPRPLHGLALARQGSACLQHLAHACLLGTCMTLLRPGEAGSS